MFPYHSPQERLQVDESDKSEGQTQDRAATIPVEEIHPSLPEVNWCAVVHRPSPCILCIIESPGDNRVGGSVNPIQYLVGQVATFQQILCHP